MKKAISITLLLLAVMLSFTGCIRMRLTLDVSKSGKIDYSLLYAMSDEMAELSADGGVTEEDIAGYIERGYTCDPYSEDGFSGYFITKKGLCDLSDGILNNEATMSKSGSNYTIDIPWDVDDADSDASSISEASAFISAQGGFAEIIISLPVEPDYHNATSVSENGKTLTWDLLNMGDRDSIHVEYSVSPFGEILKFCIIAALIIGVILGVVILIKELGKKKVAKKAESEQIEKLTAYKKLLDENLITVEDYNRMKDELLGIQTQPTENNASDSQDNPSSEESNI